MKVERVKIEELTADPANVRKHNEKNLAAIKASLRRFGQQKPVVVDGAGIVRAGNGTLAAAISLGWSHLDIVRTELVGAEATAYAIADNRTAELAEWDADALAQTMAALEIEDEELASSTGFEPGDIDLLKQLEAGEDTISEKYTAKVKIPIYEPRGKCPSLAELVNQRKVLELQEQIKAAKIPEDVRAFLMVAAQRHAEFNYQNVAEYYAHASPEVQDLFERSALVIIDFDKAIENGYVRLTDELCKIAGMEKEDAE